MVNDSDSKRIELKLVKKKDQPFYRIADPSYYLFKQIQRCLTQQPRPSPPHGLPLPFQLPLRSQPLYSEKHLQAHSRKE
ncbi:hypothetical protein [Bacillus thermotolerans]|uniref:hypothetical protein n=1 Tax=Bacillus thermotolerans TaxID=1221996 RepID=UPI00058945EC|nr:hypothetical protein [Bacillus thermotolerans]KKB42099.1 hypothetical protein QY96_01573 [Bacillus thermotolerans]